MSASFLTDIRKIAEDVTAQIGCYLYDIEFVGLGAGRTLRLSIDRDVEGGASIEDCSSVSRALNAQLETDEEIIPGGQYSLEVSTPGLERVLKEPRHFEKVLGKKISVKSFKPLLEFNEHLPELGLAKQIQGSLLSYDDSGLRISIGVHADASRARSSLVQSSAVESSLVQSSSGDNSVEDDSTQLEKTVRVENEKVVFVPFDSVTKAHVVFEFVDPSAQKGPKKGQKKGPKKDKSKK